MACLSKLVKLYLFLLMGFFDLDDFIRTSDMTCLLKRVIDKSNMSMINLLSVFFFFLKSVL